MGCTSSSSDSSQTKTTRRSQQQQVSTIVDNKNDGNEFSTFEIDAFPRPDDETFFPKNDLGCISAPMDSTRSTPHNPLDANDSVGLSRLSLTTTTVTDQTTNDDASYHAEPETRMGGGDTMEEATQQQQQQQTQGIPLPSSAVDIFGFNDNADNDNNYFSVAPTSTSSSQPTAVAGGSIDDNEHRQIELSALVSEGHSASRTSTGAGGLWGATPSDVGCGDSMAEVLMYHSYRSCQPPGLFTPAATHVSTARSSSSAKNPAIGDLAGQPSSSNSFLKASESENIEKLLADSSEVSRLSIHRVASTVGDRCPEPQDPGWWKAYV